MAAPNHAPNSADMRKIDETFRRGDLPLTASLLKRAVGRRFIRAIAETFRAPPVNSANRRLSAVQ
jgi:hypothetical protein